MKASEEPLKAQVEVELVQAEATCIFHVHRNSRALYYRTDLEVI
jgi:hypothetical protein